MKKVEPLTEWRMGQLLDGEMAQTVPGVVPGSVLHDLTEAGVLADPYVGLGEAAASWVADADFRYESVILVGAGQDRCDLVVQGLDGHAVLRLDGVEFARTQNQHRSYRFDLRSLAEPGKHLLSIDLLSPRRSARDFEERVEAKPLVGDTPPYNAVRKMACSFGSDWGPSLPSAAVWKPVEVEYWDAARFEEVLCRIRLDENGVGQVAVTARLERAEPCEAVVVAHLQHPDGTVTTVRANSVEDQVTLELSVLEPELWWPRGYGGHSLYELRLELWSAGENHDSWHRSVGFRTVEVVDEPDEHGIPFTLQANGQPILVKGANWTPDDFARPFAGADYPSSIADAVDANMNLLRVWGGGVFESEEFYELCDRAGLLVWQDFLFSCACYSEHEELATEITGEARENIIRLSTHPSLAVWNGGNETDEGYHNWGFRDRMPEGAAWGDGYYRGILPELLAELDPDRPYIPSSPFSPADPSLPTDPSQGTSHSWKVWYSRDYTAYAESVPRFVAEFGFLGAPAYSTLLRALDGQPVSLDSPALLSHQKADDGFGRLERGWRAHLPAPADFDDWHFTTQLNQARAVRFGIQHFRSHWPQTSGSVIWQLKDCWPVIGYAAVDSDRHRKPLWHALRSIYSDRVLMIVRRDDELVLIAGNDTSEAWQASVTVGVRHFDGTVVTSRNLLLHVPPRASSATKLEHAYSIAGSLDTVVTAEADGVERAYWYGEEDNRLELPAATFESRVRARPGGYDLELRSQVFVKDLCVFPDRLDASAKVDRALVTLFPDERAAFHITSDAHLDEARLVEAPVVRSANDLVSDR